MNTTNRSRLHLAAVVLLSLGLAACGVDDTSGQDCGGEPCLDGSSDRPGTVEQPLPCGDMSNCDEPPDDGGGGGGTGSTCYAPSSCPGWCDYSPKTPCLTEQFTGYRVLSYCEPVSGNPCGAVRQYYIKTDGTCFGMERLVGESIASCGG